MWEVEKGGFILLREKETQSEKCEKFRNPGNNFLETTKSLETKRSLETKEILGNLRSSNKGKV